MGIGGRSRTTLARDKRVKCFGRQVGPNVAFDCEAHRSPQVLAESVTKQEMTESQAIRIVKNALFDNANRIYKLDLTPNWSED